MQLHHNIPTLGGLGEPPPRSRREQLALDGAQARQQIAGILDSARRRALALAAGRALALLVAGLALAPLLGALLAAANGALLARLPGALPAAIAAALVVSDRVRPPSPRTATAPGNPRPLAH